MRTLDRYLGREVLKAALLAVVALTALDAFFGLIIELEDIGRQRYDLLDAFTYVAMTLPRRIMEVLPTGALIGCLLGLGGMAARSELVAVRAAGVSVGRIAWGVAKAGLVLVIAAAVLGEFIAPWSESYATHLRTKEQRDVTHASAHPGAWLRDGRGYARVGYVAPDGELLNVTLFTFDDSRRLTEAASARRAAISDGRWVLHGATLSRLDGQGVTTARDVRIERPTLLDPQLVRVVMLDPENLTASALQRYVTYLESLGEDPRRYRQAFWSKLAAPLQGLVMLLVGLPFAFGSARDTPLGKRLVIGIVVGLLFLLVSRLFSQAGHAFEMHPVVASLLPSLLFLGVATFALRRVR
ncbi:MAG: LPS export ABC transporter permease LptG [Gammaproteobacteria bacterium]|nr:LPS export ABC transporter permease LptG [Gammaproteobacteria bacterium]